MAIETANRAAESLLAQGLLGDAAREALLASAMPGFLVESAGARVLWSSHDAARRLGFAQATGFMQAGLPPLAAGTQRLAALARGIDPEAPRRLERLRFNIGFRSLVLTALCEPLRLAEGGLALLVSLVEARPVRQDTYMPDAYLPEMPDPGEPMAAQSAATPPPDTDLDAPLVETPEFSRRHDDVSPEAASTPDGPARNAEPGQAGVEPAHEGAVAIGQPGWTSLPAEARHPLRFVFALDANGIVERVTPPLAEAVGSAHAEITGQVLAGVVGSFDAPAAEAIRSAILGGQTWSGICVRWPVAGTDLVIPVDLSALPLTNTEHGLTGFSGFGRCHIERAEVQAPAEIAAAPAPAAEAEQATTADPDLQAALEAFGAGAEEAGEHAAAIESSVSEELAKDTDPAEMPPESVPAPGFPAAPANDPGTARLPEPAKPAEPSGQNVFSLRAGQPAATPHPANGKNGLSMAERNAFREIARALGAKFDLDTPDVPLEAPAASSPPPKASGNPGIPAGEPPLFAVDSPSSTPAYGAVGSEALLDRLPIGLLVLRGDAPLFANQTLLDLTGYPDLKTFLGEDGAKAIFRKGSVPRDRDAGFDTVVLTSRDGEMMPVDAHLQRIDWAGDKATLISMRRATELEQGKALRSVALDLKRTRSEAQELRAVLDTATDGVITLDEKGRILSLNGAAEALFGLSQNEVSGASFTTLLLNESHADALDYFEGLRASGVRSVLNDGRDVFGREKKGGRIPLFMTLGRISDDEPRRFCAVLRDLTAWKRAEAELTEARRAAEMASAKKSDFLTKISHEIRTPMNAIIGFAEVMMEERLGDIGNAKYKEYLGDIRTSGQHVVSLVNDLLDLAKIEAGRMELNFAATDLNTIVASSVAILQPQANQNRVLVRTQLAQKLPQVVADERSIRQIILNMLSNATRFTESGGQVIVATALLDTGEAVIRIRDTGVGMTATEIEQALEPFRQVGTRRDHGGTGLGLPLTRALVEANRANFSIRSTPGEGTMIEITFPSTRVLAE